MSSQPFSANTTVLIIGIILLSFLIMYIVNSFFIYREQGTIKNVTELSKIQDLLLQDRAAQFGQKIDGFADLSTPTKCDLSGNVSLLNIQPITLKQAGFIGPLNAGVFNEDIFTLNALKAGSRTFLFQIDYYEGTAKDPALFPAPLEPCLLYRDDNGNLVSLNAGSILNMSTSIAQYAFSNIVPLNTDPVVIILYGLRSPDPILKPKEYLAYCSKIAKQLNPLMPKMIDPTVYRRQGGESDLFSSPFSIFRGQVIILSNFDTTIFRNTTLFSKLNIPTYSPNDDLDYVTHAQLYTDDTTTGLTRFAPTGKRTYGRVTTVDTLLGLSKSDQIGWATKNSDYFTVVLSKPTSNLSVIDTKTLIKKIGVNILPIDIFFQDVNDTKDLLTLWNNCAWNLKPFALWPAPAPIAAPALFTPPQQQCAIQ